LKELQRRYIRISALATVTHLKKFIALKLMQSMDSFVEIDILCNKELLGKDHNLKFVYMTRWRHQEGPLKLQYRPRLLKELS
jgi:polycomb group RING finger protein 3